MGGVGGGKLMPELGGQPRAQDLCSGLEKPRPGPAPGPAPPQRSGLALSRRAAHLGGGQEGGDGGGGWGECVALLRSRIGWSSWRNAGFAPDFLQDSTQFIG